MIDIANIKKTLSLLPISEEIKSDIINNTETFSKFIEFLSSKYQISFEEAESKFQKSLKEKLGDKVPSDMKEAISLSAQHSFEYAEEQEYNNSQELKDSIINLNNSLKSILNGIK